MPAGGSRDAQPQPQAPTEPTVSLGSGDGPHKPEGPPGALATISSAGFGNAGLALDLPTLVLAVPGSPVAQAARGIGTSRGLTGWGGASQSILGTGKDAGRRGSFAPRCLLGDWYKLGVTGLG